MGMLGCSSVMLVSGCLNGVMGCNGDGGDRRLPISPPRDPLFMKGSPTLSHHLEGLDPMGDGSSDVACPGPAFPGWKGGINGAGGSCVAVPAPCAHHCIP